jgi:twitching motility two-component system response regulator PilH
MARILIVDDSATQVYSLRKILMKHGHEVLVAGDGVEGVQVAKAELPDLILMDVVMPKLNGFQATRQLTRDTATRHIPIIMVTTKDQETDKIWGERQGAKRYITKPVDENYLIKTINEVMGILGARQST